MAVLVRLSQCWYPSDMSQISAPPPNARHGRSRAAPQTYSARFKSSALYRLLLLGQAPKGVRFTVPELWPGNPDTGRDILAGTFRHRDEVHNLSSANDLPANASATWIAWFHGHSWLRDLCALGGGEAPYFAREWLSAWMDNNRTWEQTAWAPAVTAERLINWCQHWSFLVRDDATGPFEKMLRRTAGRDARHLLWTIPPTDAGFIRLHAIKGQAYGVFALLGGEGRMARTLNMLEREISAQVLPDGGHVERSPQTLSDVLKDLLELRALLSTATGDVPGFLQNAIDRVAPMLRALRHPDGGLAVFNGGLEGDPARLDMILAQTDSNAKPPRNAPHAGFQRLNAGAVNIIMDCGQPSSVGRSQHAGTLSFELSIGKHRLFVNCGARQGRQDPWRTALAATAAHSSMSVNETSSSAFALDGKLRQRPEHVTCNRQDVDEGTLAEASHDGYMDAFGLTHHRALFLASHGTDIRGEDRLVGAGGEHFTLRFHLHPSVKASVLGDGHDVLLHLPGKEAWRLRTSAQDVKLEASVYLGHGGEQRRSEQIVIDGPLSGNGALVKWALTRDRT